MANKKPQIKFGHITVIPKIDIKEIDKRIREQRKFADERLKRVRNQIFRKDI